MMHYSECCWWYPPNCIYMLKEEEHFMTSCGWSLSTGDSMATMGDLSSFSHLDFASHVRQVDFIVLPITMSKSSWDKKMKVMCCFHDWKLIPSYRSTLVVTSTSSQKNETKQSYYIDYISDYWTNLIKWQKLQRYNQREVFTRERTIQNGQSI